MKEQLYYIQDTRTFVGNAVVWWCKDSKGYTSKFENAGKYSKEEARSICENKIHRAWPCEYIDNNIQSQYKIVDMQYLNRTESGIK